MEELLKILTSFQQADLCQGYQCHKDCPIGRELCDEICNVQEQLSHKIVIK
ncbi:MAG: hypothetical protein ACRCX8_11395 [Sarcina sp.]